MVRRFFFFRSFTQNQRTAMSMLETIQEKIAHLPDDAQGELLSFLEYLEEKFATPTVSDEEYQKLLEAELNRRLEALRRGDSVLFTSEEVDEHLNRHFGW